MGEDARISKTTDSNLSCSHESAKLRYTSQVDAPTGVSTTILYYTIQLRNLSATQAVHTDVVSKRLPSLVLRSGETGQQMCTCIFFNKAEPQTILLL